MTDERPNKAERVLVIGTPDQCEKLRRSDGWNDGTWQPDLLDLDDFLAGEAKPRQSHWVDLQRVVVWATPNFDERDTRALALAQEKLGPHADRARLTMFEVEVEDEEERAERRKWRARYDALEVEDARRWAKARLDAKERAEVIGERVRMTGREFAKLPKPAAVMTEILAAEVNILAGPEASGKSLWLRDLTLCVATGRAWHGHRVPEQRDVLLVFSEGTHDFEDRYQRHPLWDEAADHVWVIDVPIDLVHGEDVDELLKEYADVRPGLVGFDVIYGMGMADDTGSKDVFPVLGAMKRISAEWHAATLAIGHPPHSHATGTRRMRGSSAWRNLAYTDYFMGEGRLTCEKSKLMRASSIVLPYRADYPELTWLSTGDVLADEATKLAIIEASVDANPGLTIRARAVDLSRDLGLGEEAARKRIASYLKAKKGLS